MGDHSTPEQHLTTRTARRLSRRQALALGLGLSAVAVTACTAPSAPASPPVSIGSPASGSSTAVTSPGSSGSESRQLATEIRYASQSMAPHLDPQGSLGHSAFMAARQVFDCLVTWDEKGEQIVPQLAHEWTRLDDYTIEFKLRDDVKFSNGEDFTAEAVKFTIDRLLNSDSPLHVSTKQQLASMQSPEVVNSTTVRIRTKDPDPILLNRMTLFFMLPPKYTAEGGDLQNKPVGTGAFKVTEFQPNSHIYYEAWDGSWRGKSTVQKASIEMIPEAATLISALRTERVDIAFSVPPDQVAALQRDGFNVTSVSSGQTMLNALLPSHPLMRDRRIREAFNHAVNKEEMVATLQAGFGKPAEGQLMMPGMTGYFEDVKAVPYDPDRARALLREAGYDGQEVLLSTTASVRPYNEAVVGYLNAVGVQARTDIIELSTLSSAVTRGWDKPMLSYTPDTYQMRDFDYIGIRYTKDWPSPQFDNDEFTQLFRQQRTEMNPQRRSELLHRLVRILRDEYAVLFLIWRDFPIVFTPKIASLATNYDVSTHLWKVEKSA